MTMQIKTKFSAFTFIEAIIVIAIIGIFSTVAIISKTSSDKREALLKAVKQVELSIREAQGQVMGTAAESGDIIPCSRGLFFVAGDNKFQSGYEKMNPDILECDVNYTLGTVKVGGEEEKPLPLININFANVEIDDILIDGGGISPSSLMFSPPDPTVYANGQTGRNMEIVLKYKGATCPSEFCRTIMVNPFGQVNINN